MPLTEDRPPTEPLQDAARRFVPRQVRRTTRGFALVLLLLAAIYVLSEAWGRLTWMPPLIWVLAYLAFVVTLRAVSASPRAVYQNAVVMVVAIAVGLLGIGFDQTAATAPANVLVSLYGIAAPVIITVHVLHRDRVTTDVIIGALCVYFFLGIDFAYLYEMIDRLYPEAFAVTSGSVDSLFYFSFMTLTTVGYGDITPVVDVARAVTVIEAVLGQVVLVAMVARLVGLQIAQRTYARDDRSAPARAD